MPIIARIEAGKQSKHMEVGYLEDRRNFTHVSDIVETYWLADELCTPGKPYLIGSSKADKSFPFVKR